MSVITGITEVVKAVAMAVAGGRKPYTSLLRRVIMWCFRVTRSDVDAISK